MKKWMIQHNGYKKACSKVVSAMQPYLDYVLCCDTKPQEKYNCITLSVDAGIRGVKITVSEADCENQSILIAGQDEAHLFYASCDFKTKYLPFVRSQPKYRRCNAPKLFDAPLCPYTYQSAPKIRQRGIWTWGHTIYDYRRFIDNMAECKMNTLIVWNDFVPTNIGEVISYAHEYYIKVYLGYTWGWDNCVPTALDDGYIREMTETALKTHREQYKDIPCDGIYFQTVTEHKNATISGRSVARTVTDMVNYIAGELLKEQPDLQILFGLHATSVLTSFSHIATVDPRISIIWEDVGAFPWNYFPQDTDGFEQTLADTRKIQTLREAGGFGGVLKGYANLDWTAFRHHEGPCPIGISTADHIGRLDAERREYKRFFLAGWLKYAPKALELIRQLPFDAMMTVLVEDACFEEHLHFPVALYAEMLWDHGRDLGDMLYEVALNPAVDFT